MHRGLNRNRLQAAIKNNACSVLAPRSLISRQNMGKFIVRWGTFQGGSNIVMITGNRLFGFNLPPRLAAWLNQPSAVNAVASLDLGPDGHFALTYRLENGSLKQLRSAGLEEWLRVPKLPLTTCIAFTFGLPHGVISMYDDPRTGTQTWVVRDLVKDMTDFMTEHGLAFNANIHEFDLGYNGTWALITGTTSGYDSPGLIEELIKSTGNVLNSGFCFNKMTNDQFYMETPLPNLRASSSWMGTLSQAINDAPVSSLIQGHYDEKGHVVVLPGHVLAAKPSTTADYLSADNFSTGLNIVSSSMEIMANVTGSAAATTAACCVIL